MKLVVQIQMSHIQYNQLLHISLCHTCCKTCVSWDKSNTAPCDEWPHTDSPYGCGLEVGLCKVSYNFIHVHMGGVSSCHLSSTAVLARDHPISRMAYLDQTCVDLTDQGIDPRCVFLMNLQQQTTVQDIATMCSELASCSFKSQGVILLIK